MDQITLFDTDDIWFGKMSEESSPQTDARITGRSLKKPQESQTRVPLFLDLRRGSGLLADSSWETDLALLGESIMQCGGVSLKGGNGFVYSLISMGTRPGEYCLNCGDKPMTPIPSKLSEILETRPNPKYDLSPKACAGILRRAEGRGKKLPELLENALKRRSLSKNGQGNRAEGKAF